MEQQEPLVSVLCLCFNHERYIVQCLDSILSQKTSFPFEIIINDDASTDSSSQILREYESKYSNIIRVIYHDVNEYSRMKNKPLVNMFELARGKYFAFCECDDFWNDDQKLQFQIDYLKSNSDIFATYHNVRIIDQNGNDINHNGSFYEKQEQYCSLELLTNKGMIGGQLASLVTRNFWNKLTQNGKEAFIRNIANGDQLIYLTCSYFGKIYFFEPHMSTYRHISLGGSSWSASVRNRNILDDKYVAFLDLEKYYEIISGSQIRFERVYNSIYADAIFLRLIHPTLENKSVVNEISKMTKVSAKTIWLVFKHCIRSVKEKIMQNFCTL